MAQAIYHIKELQTPLTNYYDDPAPYEHEPYGYEDELTIEESDLFYEEDFVDYTPPLRVQIPDNSRYMMVILLAVVGFVLLFGLTLVPRLTMHWETQESPPLVAIEAVEESNIQTEQTKTAILASHLAPFFAQPVLYWEEQILHWSAQHGVDPNLTATIMQIESCGDPQAVSHAGAQGLFQVMPFHFAEGEVMLEPDTNAKRGVGYLAEQLAYFSDPYLAMAAYNGGPGNAIKAQQLWPAETQRYYYWGQGIYDDAQAGQTISPRLQEWMQAGGTSLCQQASHRLGLNN